MKNIVYSRISRDRNKRFQIITNIVEEKGEKYVLKTAACPEAVGHIQSLKENYETLCQCYGKSIHIAPCTLVDEGTARFQFIEGETLTDRIIKLYQAGEAKKATEIIIGVFNIIETRSKGYFEPDEKYREIFGEFHYVKPLKGVVPGAIDWHFNNILVDKNDALWLIDYEWIYDFPLPVNFIFYRSIKMLSFSGGIDQKYVDHLMELFEIDDGQITDYQGMETAFSESVRNGSQPYTLYDWKNKLARVNMIHDLNNLSVNNPKVFPDYGDSYSESTKIVCTDFDFRYGFLNTGVVFPDVPQRIRFDPVDGLYCLVSEIKITANGTELPISWHNGLDLNGVLFFDTIDSNIYYENTVGAREFYITAKISAFCDEKLWHALKSLQPLKADYDHLQAQASETYHQCVDAQTQLALVSGRLSETATALLNSQNQVIGLQERLSELQRSFDLSQLSLSEAQAQAALSDSKLKTALAEKGQMQRSLEQLCCEAESLRNCYDNIRNSTSWKITGPVRKMLDGIKSIFKKK